eukprot:2442445-Ditylum_brightwellii.AAC.1
MIEKLHNDYLLGSPVYSNTLEAAYDPINGWKDDAYQKAIGGTTNGALSFGTICEASSKQEGGDGDGEVVSLANGAKTRPDVKCFKYGKKGHFSNQCPEENQGGGTTMLTVGETQDFQFTTYCYEEDNSDGDIMPLLLSCQTKDSSDDKN